MDFIKENWYFVFLIPLVWTLFRMLLDILSICEYQPIKTTIVK
jgi:hypothetical protein